MDRIKDFGVLMIVIEKYMNFEFILLYAQHYILVDIFHI